MRTVTEGLDAGVRAAFTRPIPKSAGKRVKYLVGQLKSTRAVGELLGMSQRQVERYVAGKAKNPRPQTAARLEREVNKRWQPRVRERAKKRAATSEGLDIDVRARLGYQGPDGTTDQSRLRHLGITLTPQYAARLFHAQETGATEAELNEIVADGLKELYFQDDGRRAASLEKVVMNDILNIEFEL